MRIVINTGGKSMQDMVRIFRCPGGLIHLSIGLMTVRLSRESFADVCHAMAKASLKLKAEELGAPDVGLKVLPGGRT